MTIGGVAVPWWVYGIIIVVIIIVLYAFYKKVTAYSPQSTAFNTTENPLPAGFDAQGQAAYADSVLSETFGSDSQALVSKLAAMEDNELVATSNAFNDQYYSKYGGTLLTQISGLSFYFTSPQTKNQLVQRMQNLNIT